MDGPQSSRIKCVTEEEALRDFLDILEVRGPNVILMCVDEETVGLLLDKLKTQDRKRFKETVTGYSWWRRVLKHLALPNYNAVELEDFHRNAFPSSPSPGLHTAAVVANMLGSGVVEVVRKQSWDIGALGSGELVTRVGVSLKFRPKQRLRPVDEQGKDVLEIFSSFRPDLATYITAKRREQVNYIANINILL